jgi:Uma2 family endonuclease
VLRATNSLLQIVEGRAIVGAQGAVRLDDYDEAQPDLVLLRPRADFYAKSHPGPDDILLVVEVADSTLEYDRVIKGALYAESGVREYWIADIAGDCVWRYTEPSGNSYRTIRKFTRGESITPDLLAACDIPVDVLLP